MSLPVSVGKVSLLLHFAGVHSYLVSSVPSCHIMYSGINSHPAGIPKESLYSQDLKTCHPLILSTYESSRGWKINSVQGKQEWTIESEIHIKDPQLEEQA